ncbi:MAG: TIGR04255 family protein [Caldithrix sp.]|nr:MAG: TIGR04255 family protein [Caldithrix sp.]
MALKYKKAPIIEAICEFTFAPISDWDLVIPGLIYDKVKSDFPKRKQLKSLDFDIASDNKTVAQQVRVTDKIQLLREDEKAFIQISPNVLSINHLKPYPSWNEYLPLIQIGFKQYVEVVKNIEILRIGLRYINRIEFLKSEEPHEKVELEDYFEFRPFIGRKLPQDYHSCKVGIQQVFEDTRDNLILQLGAEKTQASDKLVIILDFDYSLVKPKQISVENVFDWIETAHLHIEDTFEACITDKLRNKFEVEK